MNGDCCLPLPPQIHGREIGTLQLGFASVHSSRAIAGEMSIRQPGASLALGRGVARLSPTGPSDLSLMSGGVPNAMLDVMIELLQRTYPSTIVSTAIGGFFDRMVRTHRSRR